MLLKEEWIDSYALKIVTSLRKKGHQAYLVGGCVRDLLAGEPPKDFDIATDALPEAARRCIPNSYVIGKRFKLVLVKRGPHQFEVATFRRSATTEELENENNPITGDNYFGTCEEDAVRRDFTVNALFYDPLEHRMVDFVHGMDDINGRTIRMIGDPVARLIEDPIRILRAIRLSHKLQFHVESTLREGIQKTHDSLAKSALPRKREEYIKILKLKEPHRVWLELYDLGVLKTILPFFSDFLDNPERRELFVHYMQQISWMISPEKTPVELFTAFLFAMLRSEFPGSELNLDAIEANANWDHFLRNQLGMFKLEISDFYRTLHVLKSLENQKTYARKGPRRQKAFIQSPFVLKALRLAYVDRHIPFPDLIFWASEIHKAQHGSFAKEFEKDVVETAPETTH
jgi:poly(A) polymerase